jgi:hypothetical protein
MSQVRSMRDAIVAMMTRHRCAVILYFLGMFLAFLMPDMADTGTKKAPQKDASPPPQTPSPGSLAYLDHKNGFRDLTFGDPPPAGMVLREQDRHGEKKIYDRPADDLRIGAAEISYISYRFYKNRLSGVMLLTKGISNSRAMLGVLTEAYGPGSRPNAYIEEYLWSGSRVMAYFKGNAITRDATTALLSVPLQKEEEADNAMKAKKGVGGL